MKRVIAAIITNDKEEILLCRKANLPYYIFPGGKPEVGDKNDIATLKREIKEELQCDCEDLIFFYRHKGKAPNKDSIEVDMYYATLLGEPMINSEIVEIVWYNSDTWLNYPMTETTEKVLSEVYRLHYKNSM